MTGLLAFWQRVRTDQRAQTALEYVAVFTGFVILTVAGLNVAGNDLQCEIKTSLCRAMTNVSENSVLICPPCDAEEGST